MPFFFLVVLFSGSLRAQEDTGLQDEFAFLEESLSEDEVKSASKHRQSIFWSPSAVTVFTRQDILASGAVDLADLLRRVSRVPLRMGLPDLGNAEVQFSNVKGGVNLAGLEAEIGASPHVGWWLFVNLNLRTHWLWGGFENDVDEISTRFNAGARYQADSGPVLDASVHYFSPLQAGAADPRKLIEENALLHCGGGFLFLGRLGYRLDVSPGEIETA